MPRNNQLSVFLHRKSKILPKIKICPISFKIYPPKKTKAAQTLSPAIVNFTILIDGLILSSVTWPFLSKHSWKALQSSWYKITKTTNWHMYERKNKLLLLLLIEFEFVECLIFFSRNCHGKLLILNCLWNIWVLFLIGKWNDI